MPEDSRAEMTCSKHAGARGFDDADGLFRLPGAALAGTNRDIPGACIFSVNAHNGHGELVLLVRGEADLATAPRLSKALTRAAGNGHARVVLDLAALEF